MKFLNKIRKNLKYIKPKDILDILIFLLVFPFSIIFKIILKIKNKKIWLICEEPNEACDNGYHLFSYIREINPDRAVYYVINKRSSHYKKIEKLGNIIQYRSFKHWLYYLSAYYNISTQKAGNPSNALFYFLQVYDILKNKRVFLQHGVIMNKVKFLFYNETKFCFFICTVAKEYDYVLKEFGYPRDSLLCLGMPRFDALHKLKCNKKKIVLMPSWRNWLSRETNFLVKATSFTNTTYYKTYLSLINNQKLISNLEKNNIDLYFFPHRNMQKFINDFKTISNRIKIVDSNNMDIQHLLKDCALMITDYSSVSIDFAYMKKPVIYYQFDNDEFRKNQYEEGYFSYEKNGFGPVVYNEEDLINNIIKVIEKDYILDPIYLKRHSDFFTFYDSKNCERIYSKLIEKEGK